MRAATPPPLPNDVAALRTLVIDLQQRLRSRDTALQERDAALQAGQQELVYLRSWIEKLKLEVARLRRMQFGRSSEQLSSRIAQLELTIEEFEASAAQQTTPTSPPVAKQQSKRQPLPVHLPRETVLHAPAANCPDCGTLLQRIGEDVSEMLEYDTTAAHQRICLPRHALAEERNGATRYRLLETLREYGRARLRESGNEERWRDRHLAYLRIFSARSHSRASD